MAAPFYNVAVDGAFVDDGTDCPTKAIADAIHTLQLTEHAADGQPASPVTVVLSRAINADPTHSAKALLAYERVRSIMMLAYPEPANADQTVGYDYRLADLLADVRHFCDVDGLDYGSVDRMGQTHYDEERDPTYSG